MGASFVNDFPKQGDGFRITALRVETASIACELVQAHPVSLSFDPV